VSRKLTMDVDVSEKVPLLLRIGHVDKLTSVKKGQAIMLLDFFKGLVEIATEFFSARRPGRAVIHPGHKRTHMRAKLKTPPIAVL